MKQASQPSFAVIFDMDGVVVDSNPYHKKALREFCEQHGYHLSDDYMKENIFGRANKDWIPRLFGDITREQMQAYAREKEALYRKIYQDHIRPIDGLIDFLSGLATRGIPRAIATSAPAENVDFTLDMTGTRKYFDIILDESDIKNGKPDPEIYLRTAEALHHPPRCCVVIEDSLSGVESAWRAECKVIGITTTHAAADFKHTSRAIDDFTRLRIEDLYELMA